MSNLELLIILITTCLSLWGIGFFILNDFSIPTKILSPHLKLLVIFPHPDDEVLTAGGVMSLSDNTTLLVLTKGERGNPNGKLNLKLKDIRTKEQQRAAEKLHVKKLIHYDYGDGELSKKKIEIQKKITQTIEKEKPEIVISYDLSGLYGHPDHMIVSNIITNTLKKNKNIQLWYATYPQKVFGMISLPDYMAIDKNYKRLRTYPTHKVFVGLKVINKIKAAKAHKSQYKSFQKGMPLPLPLSFYHSLTVFEYFHKV